MTEEELEGRLSAIELVTSLWMATKLSDDPDPLANLRWFDTFMENAIDMIVRRGDSPYSVEVAVHMVEPLRKLAASTEALVLSGMPRG